jgi:dTDP-4-amino-4,6-dideoxygalactose transaminase
MNKNIKMVDLYGQYASIKEEINVAINKVLENTNFINGNQVKDFAENLKNYLGAKHVIPCANGTDALQIAYMALNLQPGDEVIMPSFNYVASAEAAALLSLKPVFVDVHKDSFNIDEQCIEDKITKRTKAIVAVHLFGQMSNMEAIMEIAGRHGLWVIEDNAQSLGAKYKFSSGKTANSGTIGHINTTSFFPTKNLGCFGDGGAILTNDEKLADISSILTKHGQREKYRYSMIGCNSRLDTLQAAILNVKLKHLDLYNSKRMEAANLYDSLLQNVPNLSIPSRSTYSSHVFHQYVVKIESSLRNKVKEGLSKAGIPSFIYYPIPLHLQEAFLFLKHNKKSIPVSEKLCTEVLALPIHTEIKAEEQEYIVSTLKKEIN